MKNIVSFPHAIQRTLTTGCVSLRCGTVPASCKIGSDLPFLCGILGLSTTWMVPSPFSYGVWSEAHQELFGWEKQRTPQEDAQCRGKLPVVQATKGVKYEPIFDTDRSSFFPCILHLMMICGKLILSFTSTTALELPKDRVLLLKATFKAANIRWRRLHKESAPHAQEVQGLFHGCDTPAHVLSIEGCAAHEAVRALGDKRGWCNSADGLHFSGDGMHLHMTATCPFRRMVCTGCYTCLLLVLFGGWSAPAVTHVCYLSFSADGLHRLLQMSPICPFRRMVCRGCYTCLLLVLFGGWSARAFTHVSHVSFSADGLHRPVHVSYSSFWRMVCTSVYTFWRMVCTGPYMPSFWRMVCTGHYTNGADPALCTLHCLRPDSIPYTVGCPCGTSTLKVFGLICGPCHQKGERLHIGTRQEHNSYPCLPLP